MACSIINTTLFNKQMLLKASYLHIKIMILYAPVIKTFTKYVHAAQNIFQ